jgi:hypothetical protein
VLFVGDFIPGCRGGGNASAFNARQEVPVQPDGSFSGGGYFHDTGRFGTEDGSFLFTGRDRGGEAIAGTASMQITLSANGKTATCGTGSFPWQVRDPLRAPGSGRFVPGAAYLGRTLQASGGFPFLMRVGRTGRQASVTAFEWSARCRDGTSVSGDVEIQDLDISRGRVTGRTSLDSLGDDGATEHISLAVAGRFGRHAVRGSLRVRVELRRDHRAVGRCDSGRVAWRAERSRQ